MKVTVLGCSSSSGVPSIAWGFGDCNPDNPKNTRSRTSALIEEGNKRLLIDAGPDLRTQFLRENIKAIDGVLFTHDHYDHTGGIVDLRDINRITGGALNIYGSKATIESIKQRYAFIFEKPQMLGTLYLTPYIKDNIIKNNFEYDIHGFKIIASEQIHGKIRSYGYRINSFGYITDFSAIVDDYQTIYKGIKKLVIACQSLDKRKSPIHATFDEVIKIIDELKVEKAYLTHMGSDIDYDYINSITPSYIEPAFDGLTFEV